MTQIQDTTIPSTERLPAKTVDLTQYLLLPGRVLFSAVFIVASFGHFSRQTIDYAAQQGVPLAQLAVPLSGLIALVGGLSILLGYRARIGAALLVVFLVPVTIQMHNFWAVADPTMAQMQQIMFMKNLSMLGGALVIAHFGAGPMSLDACGERRFRQHHQPRGW
jgi:putative oxidoreductase